MRTDARSADPRSSDRRAPPCACLWVRSSRARTLVATGAEAPSYSKPRGSLRTMKHAGRSHHWRQQACNDAGPPTRCVSSAVSERDAPGSSDPIGEIARAGAFSSRCRTALVAACECGCRCFSSAAVREILAHRSDTGIHLGPLRPTKAHNRHSKEAARSRHTIDCTQCDMQPASQRAPPPHRAAMIWGRQAPLTAL